MGGAGPSRYRPVGVSGQSRNRLVGVFGRSPSDLVGVARQARDPHWIGRTVTFSSFAALHNSSRSVLHSEHSMHSISVDIRQIACFVWF